MTEQNHQLSDEQVAELEQAIQDADAGKFASPEAVQALRQRYLG